MIFRIIFSIMYNISLFDWVLFFFCFLVFILGWDGVGGVWEGYWLFMFGIGWLLLLMGGIKGLFKK